MGKVWPHSAEIGGSLGKQLPHCLQLSGYPNTTDHEDIPPKIGATESRLWNLSKLNDKHRLQWSQSKEETKSGDIKPLDSGEPFWNSAPVQLPFTHKEYTETVLSAEWCPCSGKGAAEGKKGPAWIKLPRFFSYPAFLLPTGATATEKEWARERI